jgi:predicted N-acetyltransferase YhbS
MARNILVRQAVEGDLEAINRIISEAMGDHSCDYAPERIKEPDTLIMVAVIDEKVVGYCTTSIDPSPSGEDRRADIDIMEVLPDYRKGGTARKLHDGTIAALKDRGINLVVATFENHKFAKLLGYTLPDETGHAYKGIS